jgi:uncharacterized protein
MTIELEPVGVVCNLSCPYCYEHPMRDAGNFRQKTYSVEKMLEGLAKEGGNFTLFGGEPLLTDIDDLETIFKWGFERYGTNGIQTNGVLITDHHIEMFKKYNVHVGISLDGPDEMNDTRWAGSLEKTREATRKSFDAIKKCLDNKLSIGLIITIHTKNGLPKHRERFKAWVKELQSWGVDGARLHPLEIDHSSVGETLALTPEQNIEFLLDMWDFEIGELNVPGKKPFRFDIFRDVEDMLRAEDNNATCTFLSCDPYTTHAVQGIDSQGNKANCGRGNKEGINWIKADVDGFERQMALYNTPQEHGGCQGCRFFITCKSHCPGTGIDMDWRNRTDTCMNWKVAFSIYEKMMVQKGEVPLSLSPDLKKYEDILMYGYSRGVELRLKHIKQYFAGKFDIEAFIQSYLNAQKFGGHMPHADHTDETGRYAMEYEEKYGYLP